MESRTRSGVKYSPPAALANIDNEVGQGRNTVSKMIEKTAADGKENRGDSIEIPTTLFYATSKQEQPNLQKNKRLSSSTPSSSSTKKRKYARRSAKIHKPMQWKQILQTLRNPRLRQLVTGTEEQQQQKQQQQMPENKPAANEDEMIVISSESDFSDMEDASEAAANLVSGPPQTAEIQTKRKFFKSGHNTNTPKQISLFENVKAKVYKGKISLIEQERPKRRRRSQRSGAIDVSFKEQQEEVDRIIRNLSPTNEEQQKENKKKQEEDEVLTNKKEKGQKENENEVPTNDKEKEHKEMDEPRILSLDYFKEICNNPNLDVVYVEKYKNLNWVGLLHAYGLLNEENFQIFVLEKDEKKMNEILAKNLTKETECLYELDRGLVIPRRAPKRRHFSIFDRPRVRVLEAPKSTRKYKMHAGWGHLQYQIDSGQRCFGATKCAYCGLLYSQNEPEEEALHERFHKAHEMIRFDGWINEDVVVRYTQTEKIKRIIRLTQASTCQQLRRLKQMIALVDTELGFSTYAIPTFFVVSLNTRNTHNVKYVNNVN